MRKCRNSQTAEYSMGNGADSKNHLTCASNRAASIRFYNTPHAFIVFMLRVLWLCARSAVSAVRVSFRTAETCRNLVCRLFESDGASRWLRGETNTLNREDIQCHSEALDSAALYEVALHWVDSVHYNPWQEPCASSIGAYRQSSLATWAQRWFGSDFIDSFSIRRLAVCRVQRCDAHPNVRRSRARR